MNCMGSYGPMILNAARSGDTINLMNTLKAAGACMNILEGVTVKYWAQEVFARDTTVKVNYNGESLSPVEFMTKVESKENEEDGGDF